MDNNINKGAAKKVRFNATDALVIVITLFLVFVFVFFLNPFGWFEGDEIWKETVIDYVIELKGVEPEVAEKIRSGESVFDSVSGDCLGRVEGVEIYSSVEWRTNGSTGKLEKISVPQKRDVLLTVSVEGKTQEGIGFIVNGKAVRVGSFLTLTISAIECNGYCIEIDPIEEE